MDFYRTIVTSPDAFTKPLKRRDDPKKVLPAPLEPSSEIKKLDDRESARKKSLILTPFENLIYYKFYDSRNRSVKMPLSPKLPVASDLYLRVLGRFHAFCRQCLMSSSLKSVSVKVKFWEQTRNDGKSVVDVWFGFKGLERDCWIAAAYISEYPIDLENLLIKI